VTVFILKASRGSRENIGALLRLREGKISQLYLGHTVQEKSHKLLPEGKTNVYQLKISYSSAVFNEMRRLVSTKWSSI
jgi:hypothetical protein